MRKIKFLCAIAVTLMLVAGACCPKLISSETNTVYKREWRDTMVNAFLVKPEFKITHDTTINNLAPCIDEPIVIEKETDKGRVRVMIDSLGRIQAECVSKEDSLKADIKLRVEKETVLKETVKVYKERENFFKKLIRNIAIGGAVLILIAGVLLYLLYKLKSKLPIP